MTTETPPDEWVTFKDLHVAEEAKLGWQVHVSGVTGTPAEAERRGWVTAHLDEQSAAARAAGWHVIDYRVFDTTSEGRPVIRGYIIVQPPLPGV